jgi:hypothetical protein
MVSRGCASGCLDEKTIVTVPIFRRNSTAPLFGDSTATQAIIFSPPFQDAPYDPPSFPNYTLPSANLSDAPPPPTPPFQSLLVFQTSIISPVVSQLNQSFCGMLEVPGNLATSGRPLTKTVVLRDVAGWRTQWVLEGLTPSTNYTVFIVENDETVSPPLYFTTKSCASLLCPRVPWTGADKLFHSIVCLLVSAFITILSRCRILRASSTPPIAVHILHSHQPSLKYLRPSHRVHSELYNLSTYFCMWARYILASTIML